MATVAIIQARMGSTRLPGKVRLELAGTPIVELMVQRLRRSRLLDEIWVAASDAPDDDEFVNSLQEKNIGVVRGSERDVLARYMIAAEACGADTIVRLTGDCPLQDSEIVDQVVSAYRETYPQVHYASNLNPPTYPDGLDAEVFSYEALRTAAVEAALPSEREHVTLYLRNHPERFGCLNVEADQDYSDHRWTLDEAADYVFLQALTAAAEAEGLVIAEACWRDLIDVAGRNPGLNTINGAIQRNEGLKKSLEQDADVRGLQVPFLQSDKAILEAGR